MWAYVGSGNATGETYVDAIKDADIQVKNSLLREPDLADTLSKTEYAVLRDDATKNALWKLSQNDLMDLIGLDPKSREVIRRQTAKHNAELRRLTKCLLQPSSEPVKTSVAGVGQNMTQSQIDELVGGASSVMGDMVLTR
jgi:hypothetical protein